MSTGSSIKDIASEKNSKETKESLKKNDNGSSLVNFVLKRRQPEAKREEHKNNIEIGLCCICPDPYNRYYEYECPQRRRKYAKDTKDDVKGKKTKPSAGCDPNMIRDVAADDTSKLCRAWGKVCDQHALIFFNSGLVRISLLQNWLLNWVLNLRRWGQ